MSTPFDFKNTFIICLPLGGVVSLAFPLISYSLAFVDQQTGSWGNFSHTLKAVQCSRLWFLWECVSGSPCQVEFLQPRFSLLNNFKRLINCLSARDVLWAKWESTSFSFHTASTLALNSRCFFSIADVFFRLGFASPACLTVVQQVVPH